MKRAQPEAQLQKAVAILLRLQFPKLLWWHVSNGSMATAKRRADLADMGLLPGVPDLALLLPNGRSGFIELKAKKGQLSDAQKAFRDAAVSRGAYWALCRDLETVKAAVRAWEADARAEMAFRERAA